MENLMKAIVFCGGLINENNRFYGTNTTQKMNFSSKDSGHIYRRNS